MARVQVARGKLVGIGDWSCRALGFLVAQRLKRLPAMKDLGSLKRLPAMKDLGSIPGLGRSPGEGNDNPLQYSCLENPMDRRAWQAPVRRVAENQTQLKRLSTNACR